MIIDGMTLDQIFPTDRARGLDLSARPQGFGAYGDTAHAFPDSLLIPQSEWQSRCEELDATKSAVPDLCDLAGLKVKDQQQTNFCVPPGTLIRMGDGSEKRIEDVKVLDEVVTAEGNVKRVTQTMVRHVKEDLFTPVMWGHSHFRATGLHPVLTKRGYVPVADLVPGDKVAFPKYLANSLRTLEAADYLDPRPYVRRERGPYSYKNGIPGRSVATITRTPVPDFLPMTEKSGRVIGLFLAEGHTSKYVTCWSFNKREINTLAAEVVTNLETEFGAKASVSLRGNSVALVSLHGKNWAPMFEQWCGVHSGHKRIHPDIASGSPEFLRGVLTGWMDGDRQRGTSAVTISRSLALNMFDIANALSYMPILSTHQREKVDKKGQFHRHAWKVGWGDKGKPNHGTEQDETHLWRKVYDIESEPYEGYVFNLEVEDDHSYVAEGLGVHNCWANGPTHCVEIVRTLQGLDPIVLSAASVACPVTGYRNQGGWGKDALDQIIKAGIVPDALWPNTAISQKYATAANLATAKKYGITGWWELEPNNIDQLMSCLFHRVPVAVGYNWWGHEVTAVRPVWVDGAIALMIDNSWGTSWGTNGRGILQGSKMSPDDAVAPRVAIAA